MIRSILLKDQTGKIGGYVLCDGQVVKARILLFCEKAVSLILLDEKGGCVQRDIEGCREEMHFESEGEPICAAVLSREGNILLSDDHQLMSRHLASLSARPACRTSPDWIVRENEKGKWEKSTRPRPERRWPPPPCVQSPVYVNGHWQTIKDEE